MPVLTRASQARRCRAAPAEPAAILALRAAAATMLAFLIAFCFVAIAAARAQTAEPRPESGLFLQGPSPEMVLKAPLVATEARIDVSGGVVRASVRQHFRNPTTDWVEGVYVFPLPERSAVDRLRMLIGERLIEGEIKDRQEAERIYREAAQAGQRASLVSGERPNIFTTKVANIGPNQQITIEIEYQDQVAIRDGLMSLRFPMVVAPRYIPGSPQPQLLPSRDDGRPLTPPRSGHGWSPDTDAVPDASRITPPVVHPSQGPVLPVFLTVTIDAGFPIASLDSRYHPVVVRTDDTGRKVVTLAEGVVPADRDFVLDWRPQIGAAPAAAIFGEARNGDSFLLVTIAPPDMRAADAPRTARDVTYIIDTSGSMEGESIRQAKAALAMALDRLQPGDRFNVIRFSSDMSSLFASPTAWSPATLRQAKGFVAALTAQGGTEMRPALRQALSAVTPEGRLHQIVFITDGAVGNEHELFQDIGARLGRARLFTVGIGSAPNSHFMRKSAELGRGVHVHIGKVEEVTERMSALIAKLERPAMTDLRVTWPGALGATAEAFPNPVPDLYAGEPVTFAVRVPGQTLAALAGELTLGGTVAGESWTRTVALNAARPAQGVASVWARARLDDIEDRAWRTGERHDVSAQATAHALKYGLVSRYTSLVAVDKEKVRPDDAPLDSRAVPTNLPKGWDYDSVFGRSRPAPAMMPAPMPAMPMRDMMRSQAMGGQAQTAKFAAPGQAPAAAEALALASPPPPPAAAQVPLPQGATPALLHMLIGLGALALAGLSAGWGRRRRG